MATIRLVARCIWADPGCKVLFREGLATGIIAANNQPGRHSTAYH